MKSRLLLRSLLCLSLFLSAFGIQKAYADHICSTEMYVDYIGTGPTDMKYKVTFITFRICIANNLILFPTTTYTVSSASLNFSQSRTLTNVSHISEKYGTTVVEDTLDDLCPDFSAINSCRVPANINYSGYQRRIYVDTVVIPNGGRAADIKFVWSSCCRLLTSAALINIASSQAFYLECGINNLIRYNNSTPRYLGKPFAFLCANQKGLMSNIPADPDGDSLYTYQFSPQISAGTNVTYSPGFTALQPMGVSGNYVVSPVSGKATFVPPSAGKYALGYRTEDYDKASKQRLSYVARDIVISVLNCTDLPPTIDSIPSNVTGVKNVDTTNGDVVYTACPQLPLNFIVNAHSNNTNGLIYMRSASVLPTGMTMTPTVTGGTGFVTINWTPTASDIGPHVISVLCVDSTCAVGQEIVLRNEFTFTINVRPGLDAGPDLLSCPLGERPVQLGSNANPASTITWTDLAGSPALYLDCTACAFPKAGPPKTYTYVVHTDDPDYACKAEDTVTVYLDTTNSVVAPQNTLIVCRPGYRTLNAVGVGPAPLANQQCGVNNPLTCAVSDQDTAFIGQGINPAVFKPNTPFYSEKVYDKYQFMIPKRDLLNAGLYSGTINTISFLNVNPTLLATAPCENMTLSMGCVYDDDFPTPINNNSFFPGLTPVATIASYTLTPNDWNEITLTAPYSWDTTTNLIVDICMGPLSAPNLVGTDPFAMTPGRAIQKADNGVNVCGGNAPTVQSYNQRPIVRLKYCPSPELPFNFTWIPGTYMNDSNKQNPDVFVARSINYAVYTVGRNGCRVRDSLHIIIPDHHLTVGPKDSIACVSQPVPLYATGADGYEWFEVQGGTFTSATGSLSCTTCSNPFATPPVTTTYAVIFTNDVNRGNPNNPGSALGCPDTLYTKVIINPLPPVRSSNRDTTIGYGKSVQLFAVGATHYTWTPVGSLNDPNSPAPIATPKETTTYVVAGQDSNGCVYRDTVKVVVDYTNRLLIPSGFTPNGDGRNDVFKIVNPNFQRLMEFRVFNRWGQEVYSTTDINSGWDGKWKNLDQPIGNYQYLIRVGSPDGNVETYKGDVNLVR